MGYPVDQWINEGEKGSSSAVRIHDVGWKEGKSRSSGQGLGVPRDDRDGDRHYNHFIAGSYPLWEIMNVLFNDRDESCSIGR